MASISTVRSTGSVVLIPGEYFSSTPQASGTAWYFDMGIGFQSATGQSAPYAGWAVQSGAVPEPTTCGLALAAVIFFAAGRGRVG